MQKKSWSTTLYIFFTVPDNKCFDDMIKGLSLAIHVPLQYDPSIATRFMQIFELLKIGLGLDMDHTVRVLQNRVKG